MKFDDIIKKAKKEWGALKKSKIPLIMIGTATCGRSAGALEALDTLKKELKKHRLKCNIIEVGCIGQCYAEPIVSIAKPPSPTIFYSNITPQKAAELIKGYLIDNNPMPNYALGTIGEGSVEGIPHLFQTPVVKHQVRRILRNCGLIDPANINHYIANNGYSGFIKALDMEPKKIIDVIKKSGLRGRGGAGFPTWRKWQFARESKAQEKYLICNADEGDPGAFMNRALIESDPHALLEGMLIAGLAIGAKEAYIYCRAEYPLALERLWNAIKQSQDLGLLGDNILDSKFSFHIKIKEGAGAFVCGEETALIASIQGNRGTPRPRPPFPATKGLWGKPTIINNVETLASAALILQNGADWFSQFGTEKSKGTKTFALVGNVKHTGLIEVPLGVTLKQIIYEIGGGVLENKVFKAVQTGGPSGGCVPYHLLDTPIDYDSLKAVGTIMGSGGIVIIDENTCMVDFARYFLDFAHKESCGECVPCRLGTKQMLEILEDITKGKGNPEDINLLIELGEAIKAGSLCGLGQTAPNPVLTTIRYFREEYLAHTKYKKCPAGVCKEIISSPCQHVCPINTEAPVYISLIAQSRFKDAYEVILKDNPLPSVCSRVCHHPCESKCQSGKWGLPIAIRALKRFVADYAFKGKIFPKKKRQKPGQEKVSIIGSGPAGLMAAYHLANKGYDVTIFEALDTPGGALAIYIPPYRLPKDILAADIKNIKNRGVKIKTNTRIGKDISFNKLLHDYKAVFIAAGTHKSRKLHIPNEDSRGVLHAIEFLRDLNQNKDINLGKNVGVIGGGSSAVDAARSALRTKGCERVILIYRRTRAEMPAFKEEVDSLLDEGIEIQFLTAPTRVIPKNGKVKGLECIKMELGEPDETGRRSPIPIEGTEFVINLDTIIVAIGEVPDLSFLGKGHRINISQKGTIIVDPQTLATNVDGVFAGGDVVTGPNTVIEAMSAGKIVSEMIDKYIRGEKIVREYDLVRPSMYIEPPELTQEEIEKAQRPEMPCLFIKERIKNFKEINLGLAKEIAVKEARRCLRCDLETEYASSLRTPKGMALPTQRTKESKKK